MVLRLALFAALAASASASLIWNDFSNSFYTNFADMKEGDLPKPVDWVVDMRDWGLVGKDHYPYLSANNPADRRCYENNGVSPANVYFKESEVVAYPARLKIPQQTKTVMALRGNGDFTPPGMGYAAGIRKKFKIDSYKDTSSLSGRWLIAEENPQRVGSTIATQYYFGPGSFEVGMKPLQDFGATTTIWAYHYNEFYPETPDPLQREQATQHNDPQFVKNCFIQANDTAEYPGGNCSCPLNSFPPHPWQQAEMDEHDHWWTANSEIDIEFPTPASNDALDKGYANMMRFNTWSGVCGTQYTYSYQVVKTVDASGKIVNVTESPGFHDNLYHQWRFDWYNNPMPGYGPTRVEFYIDGVMQRNVSHNNPDDPDPRVRKTEWEFLQLMPQRPMRLWIGVWFSYWGTASPANCLTQNDIQDPFSTTCAPWGDASDPENPENPVWREALLDYVKITPMKEWGAALWEPELFMMDGTARTAYPYALPYANTKAGTIPKQSETGLSDDFSATDVDVSRWHVSQSNFSPREQTVWGQMCHGSDCKGSLGDLVGTRVVQFSGGFSPKNVIAGGKDSTGRTWVALQANGDLINTDVLGDNLIGGIRTDGRKVGSSLVTAQYFGPGIFKASVALAGSDGPGTVQSFLLRADAAWEENSDQFKAHCGGAKYMPTSSDCRAFCLAATGWPKGSGFWQEQNHLRLDLPWYASEENTNPDQWSFSNARVYNSIGVCEQGSGVGVNGSSLPMASPEFAEFIMPTGLGSAPFTNPDGSRRFVDVELEWHTWNNASCPRTITWSIDGNVVYQSDCSEETMARIPTTAMRMWFMLDFVEQAGTPWWTSQQALIDSVSVTQFDEPVDRLIESFPYQKFAQPEQFMKDWGTDSLLSNAAKARGLRG